MIYNEKQTGMAAMAACAVLWSCGGILIKLVNWHPLATAGIRSILAGAFILLILKKPRFRFSKIEIMAALAHSLTMIFFVSATRTTTAANAILLQYTAPIYVAILGGFILKEKPSIHHWLALVTILLGLGLFFKDELGPGHGLGNLLGLASGISFALFSIFMRLQKEGNPLESLLLSNFLTALIGIPFYFQGPGPDLTGWLSIGALGIFQTGLSLMLFSYGIKRIRALSAMLIAALEPLLNPLWVFLITGEKPGYWSLIGGLIILSAVTSSSVLSSLKPQEKPWPLHETQQ
ncbi:EamA/RhaT family transporter [Oceanispirochaeta crateris]|uniref:EamA/RhaT family transporter n=1 Tax=Oceanispirochaeta crateris TaxID=2518645 RepID=A0A5C1QSV3_9SPIO|nr:EamA family transporter [Oceanispirochaeta crateris]QEN09694.1 EamA/RhaT family transporter [Oceanispirochaeta crateris]